MYRFVPYALLFLLTALVQIFLFDHIGNLVHNFVRLDLRHVLRRRNRLRVYLSLAVAHDIL